MLDKLERIKQRYDELGERLSDPAVIGDQNLFRELAKEHASLEEIVSVYGLYRAALASGEECKAILNDSDDAEMRELAHEELKESESEAEKLGEHLPHELLPSFLKDLLA